MKKWKTLFSLAFERIFRKIKISRSFLNPRCTAEVQLSPNFHRASRRSRLFYFFLPRWETVATLRSNKSVFPLQTTYAVALTLPSSLRYQAGSQGKVENEMPGSPGVRGWGGRDATLFVPPFLTIFSIHCRCFFSIFFFFFPRLSSVLDRPITRPRASPSIFQLLIDRWID